MKLWTIQEESFYEKLKIEGYIQGIDFKTLIGSFDSELTPQYKWLTRQLCQRGLTQKQIWPIWAWYKYNGVHKKPDLRHSGHNLKGKSCICIEFEAEEKMVILSQFDMWVCILNGFYLPYNEYESTKIEKIEDAGKLTRSRIKQSWPRMFDLSFGHEDFWGSLDKRWIQACVSEIQKEQIINIQKFTAR